MWKWNSNIILLDTCKNDCFLDWDDIIIYYGLDIYSRYDESLSENFSISNITSNICISKKWREKNISPERL